MLGDNNKKQKTMYINYFFKTFFAQTFPLYLSENVCVLKKWFIYYRFSLTHCTFLHSSTALAYIYV